MQENVLLESEITPDAFQYRCENNHPFGVTWNNSTNSHFAGYMNHLSEKVAFTLETAYFGTKENPFAEERIKKLGNCFAKAMLTYLSE